MCIEGHCGQHPQHMWHQLLERLPRPKLQLHFWECPLRHAVLGFFFKPVGMLLPHELLATLYHCYPKVWDRFVYVSQSRCRQFWDAVSDTVHFRTHPVRHREGFKQCAIPCKIHGDGTPVVSLGKSWSKLVDIFSICSMLSTGSTRLRNFMLWMVHQSLQSATAGHHTLHSFYRKLAWSLNAAYLGEWPEVDWRGRPLQGRRGQLADGYFWVVWVLCGDSDHLFKAYDLPNATSNSPCPLCPCNSGDLPWWDFRPHAAWQDSLPLSLS